MRPFRRIAVALGAILVVVAVGAGGCESADDTARNEAQAQKAEGPSLEKANLEEKRKREEKADAIRYVYLMNYGQIVGYYVTKGKISASGSQATPMDQIHWTCRSSHGCSPVVVDGPQDDGSYGAGDPGIFFFLADGTMVVTDLDYIQSDRPLPVNVPQLG